MIHPATRLQYIGEHKGIGVVATEFIPKGTITWIFDEMDMVFTPEQMEQMDPLYKEFMEVYSYVDHDGRSILCWDHARFVNHSYVSNCISTAYNFELAVRDIQPGEELTDDYGYLNLTEPFMAPPEEGSSRVMVLPDDLERYFGIWDVQLIEAFKQFNSVKQPLARLIDKQYLGKVKAVADGNEEMDSILTCRYKK